MGYFVNNPLKWKFVYKYRIMRMKLAAYRRVVDATIGVRTAIHALWTNHFSQLLPNVNALLSNATKNV